jgi:hypothetical protein
VNEKVGKNGLGYMKTERERERERHTHTHTHIHRTFAVTGRNV